MNKIKDNLSKKPMDVMPVEEPDQSPELQTLKPTIYIDINENQRNKS